MSSDLPETHRSSRAMARVLASYMTCPHEIQLRIREDFDCPPSIGTIQQMRAEHLAGPKRQRMPMASTPSDGYWPTEASEKAALSSDAFLRRLRQAYPDRFAA